MYAPGGDENVAVAPPKRSDNRLRLCMPREGTKTCSWFQPDRIYHKIEIMYAPGGDENYKFIKHSDFLFIN